VVNAVYYAELSGDLIVADYAMQNLSGLNLTWNWYCSCSWWSMRLCLYCTLS